MPAPDYEHRLDTLEQQGVENKNRLLHVERTVDIIGRQVGDLGTKLDTVVNAVTTVSARPQWEFQKILDLATKGVVLSVAVAGLITYISSNINASVIVENRLRAEFLRERLDNGWFRPSAFHIRSPNGPVTPQ